MKTYQLRMTWYLHRVRPKKAPRIEHIKRMPLAGPRLQLDDKVIALGQWARVVHVTDMTVALQFANRTVTYPYRVRCECGSAFCEHELKL